MMFPIVRVEHQRWLRRPTNKRSSFCGILSSSFALIDTFKRVVVAHGVEGESMNVVVCVEKGDRGDHGGSVVRRLQTYNVS